MASFQSHFLLLLVIVAASFIVTSAKGYHRPRGNHGRPPPPRYTRFNITPPVNNVPKTNVTNASPPPLSHEFLWAHNKVRASMNEPLLKWDKQLARHARRWANKRAWDCKMMHSMGPYGENLFWGGRDHWTPTEVVRSWVDEYKYFNPDANNCDAGQMCGHYTQVVWKDTTKLGCARIKCSSGGVLIVCNYDPPGNYVNESPFGTGVNSVPIENPLTVPFIPSMPFNQSPSDAVPEVPA